MQNVILLTIDTLRTDVIGCYGGGDLTPNLDAISDKTICFKNAFSGGPYTQASFPGILSSSYYLDFGLKKGCPPQRVLVSEPLKKAGFTTAAFHSNAYLADFFGWNKGWDLFYDSMDADVTDEVPYIKASEINRLTGDWLKKQKKNDKPFFLWVHYMDVHEPYVPKDKYIQAIDPSISLTKQEMMSLFKETLLQRDISSPEKIELLKKLYHAHVLEVDDAFQELLDTLKETDFHDTIIIITSDHGDEFGEHGGLSHDGKMYQELVHVPLLIYDPARTEGQVFDPLVSTLDIPPTITKLFHVDPPQAWHGRSLLPLEEYTSQGAFGEAIDKQGSREKGNEGEVHFYCYDHLKIIYYEESDSWELYDLDADPEEKNNIIHQNTLTEFMMKKIIPRIKRYEKKEKKE